MTSSIVSASPSACVSNASASASAAADVDVSVASSAAYTPVATSVKMLTDRVSSNSLVQASLQRLQSLVPASVSQQAASAAVQASALGQSLAAPLVTRVDQNLNSAIVKLLALPAYGSAKVHQADELAFSYTPERLKPTYSATRQRVSDAVTHAVQLSDRTVEKVQRVRSEQTKALWSALEQVNAQAASLKQAVAQTSSQARQALDLTARLNELQSTVAQAIDVAQQKRAQARHLSQEILAQVTDLTMQLTHFLESNLSEGQRRLVADFWSRLLEGVQVLKESLHLGGTAAASPVASRSDSNASNVELDASDSEGSARAVPLDGVAAAAEPNHVDGAHVLVEESVGVDAESDSKTSADGSVTLSKRKKGGKHAKHAAAAQADEEHKQKVAAENE